MWDTVLAKHLSYLIFMPSPSKTFSGGVILFSGVSLCEWVCVSQKRYEHHISNKNQWREFHPILVTDVPGFIGVPCWLQFVVIHQGRSRQWPEKLGEYNISVTIGANFTKIRSQMYLGQEIYWWCFRTKRSKIMVTARDEPENWIYLRN